MRNGHPYPLPLHVLQDYCHPAEDSPFHRPRLHEGETLVANGHLALKIRKGSWMDSEMPPAQECPDFLKRFRSLDWNAPFHSTDWRHLADVAPRLFDRGEISAWLRGKTGPSPVVFVAGRFRARLTMLHLVARLPRVEVFTGEADPSKPLWFRFSGGCGLIAYNPALAMNSIAFSIFEPERCVYTDTRLSKRTPFLGLEMPGAPWPPPEPID